MLNIADAAAIVVRNEATVKFEVDLNLCPPICPNLPYVEIYVTIPNVDGAEPMIMRQHVLEEVKENQRREAVILKLETVLRRRKAKLAKIRSELGPAVCYYP